jgi:hypothetical protein
MDGMPLTDRKRENVGTRSAHLTDRVPPPAEAAVNVTVSAQLHREQRVRRRHLDRDVAARVDEVPRDGPTQAGQGVGSGDGKVQPGDFPAATRGNPLCRCGNNGVCAGVDVERVDVMRGPAVGLSQRKGSTANDANPNLLVGGAQFIDKVSQAINDVHPGEYRRHVRR